MFMAKGDHIYVDCRAYTHHGIDCGDGRVIHYSKSSGCAVLSITSDLAFSSGRSIMIKKYDKSYSPDVVIRRAEARLGEAAYHLMFNNCEHFATWCKTGVHKSEQINYLFGLSGAGIASGLAAIGSTVEMKVAGGFVITVAAPVAIATVGFSAYQIWKRRSNYRWEQHSFARLGKKKRSSSSIWGY
jgi:Lecithin retinol acyltransferase